MHKSSQPGGYQYDDDEDYVPTKKVKYSSKEDSPFSNKKHTLDSDEEDEDEIAKIKRNKQDVLKDEDIDGQEDATIDMEGETKITPFNMKEELEEGHFDRDGFYHFKKGTDQLKDAWLDNIDWVKVKKQGEDAKKYGSDVDSDSEGDSGAPYVPTQQEKEDLIKVYEKIFPYLKEGETISKALKRLSGNPKRMSSAERWKLKKQGKLDTSGSSMEEFLKLTELINKVIDTGNMDIYLETYEMINLKIKRFRAGSAPVVSEPAMDMFSDGPLPGGLTKDAKSLDDINSQEKDTFDAVKWEFRWENKEEAKIHGPYSTQQMIRWKESKYFKQGVYVRKTTEQSGPWYLSSRIDFDLYV